MASLRCRCGHYIIALRFLLLSSIFFLAYSQPSQIGCLPYFHTWCGLSANSGCRSEVCSTRLAEKYRTQKIAKNSPSGNHRINLSGYIFASKVCIDNRKNVKQQYPLHMFSQYGELRPITGWDRFTSLGHSRKFQRVSRLAFVTAATSLTGGQPNFPRCLAVSWPGTLYIYIFGRSCPLTEFCPVQNSLHCESKKGATLTIAITLSLLDRFANFFHCCKEQ